MNLRTTVARLNCRPGQTHLSRSALARSHGARQATADGPSVV